MKIKSAQNSASLTIEMVGSDLSVSVINEGFCGANPNIWVQTEDLRSFASGLRFCEQTGKGKAILSGQSPGELELTIESSNGTDGFTLSYVLGKSAYPRAHSLKGAFTIDPKLFGRLVADLEELAVV